MNAPHDYKPALRSQDLKPYAPQHSNEQLPKTHKALVGITGKGFMALHHAARGYQFAFIESGMMSRWWFKRGGQSVDILADLVASADKRGRRWRIIHVISGEIRSEG